VEHAARLLFDEGAGGITAAGMEQVRGLPQVTGRLEQIERTFRTTARPFRGIFSCYYP
jgi:hypothetical protein